jgi:hypothetical protein
VHNQHVPFAYADVSELLDDLCSADLPTFSLDRNNLA